MSLALLSDSTTATPFIATILALICLPCLQIGLVYKQLWYTDIAAELSHHLSNCSCPCYDGYLEGRAYYSHGTPHFYSSTYRYVYINGELTSALLLALLACSVLMLYKTMETIWCLTFWRPGIICALVANLLIAYNLFWSTFQSINAQKLAASLHYAVFYSLQACLCWSLVYLAGASQTPRPLALNWAAVLSFGPLLIKSINLLTLLQYVSRQVMLRDYWLAMLHTAVHLATAFCLSRLQASLWKRVLASSRLICLDCILIVLMWFFNILT